MILAQSECLGFGKATVVLAIKLVKLALRIGQKIWQGDFELEVNVGSHDWVGFIRIEATALGG